MHEIRLQRFGRVLTEARIVNVIDGEETPVLELYDVLLWVDAKNLRMLTLRIS